MRVTIDLFPILRPRATLPDGLLPEGCEGYEVDPNISARNEELKRMLDFPEVARVEIAKHGRETTLIAASTKDDRDSKFLVIMDTKRRVRETWPW